MSEMSEPTSDTLLNIHICVLTRVTMTRPRSIASRPNRSTPCLTLSLSFSSAAAHCSAIGANLQASVQLSELGLS